MAADDPTKQRFEILRKRARQAATSESQKEKEGLSRRFAQLGQVGSGAQIRAEAQAAERGAKRLQRAEETVGLAELGERQRLSEVAEARKFARGEREAGQSFAAEQAGVGRQFAAQQAGVGRQFAAQQAGLGRRFTAEQAGVGRKFAAQQAGLGRSFAAGQAREGREFSREQADLQRKFMTGERLGAQDFASLEALAGRKFSREERVEAQRFADRQGTLSRIFTANQNNLNRALQRVGIDMQRRSFNEGIRQFNLEFIRDTDTINFNKKMAEDAADKTLWDDLGLGGLSFPSGPTIGGAIVGGAAGGPVGALAGAVFGGGR